MWRDAKGTFVGPAVVPDAPLYFDARELVWFVNPSTGQFEPDTESIGYDEADCQGNAYVSASLARLVFKAEGDSADTYRTLSDRYVATKVQLKSSRYGSSCSNFTSEQNMVPLADTLPATPIVKPAVTFVAPLRLVMP